MLDILEINKSIWIAAGGLVAAFTLITFRFLSKSSPLETLKEEAQRKLNEVMLQSKVAILEGELAKKERIDIPEDVKKKAVSDALDDIKRNATPEIIAAIESGIERLSEKKSLIADLDVSMERTLGRLYDQLYRLNRSSQIDLSLGVGITMLAMVMLYLFAQQVGNSVLDPVHFLLAFAPRISLVIFVEIFGYFFLRLHTATIKEVKFLHNEITSVEGRFMAFRASFQCGSDVASAIISFLNFERNGAIGKGQTTVELELARVDSRDNRIMLDKALAILEAFSKKVS